MTIEEINQKVFEEIGKCKDLKTLEKIRIKYLGRKGELTNILKSLKDLPIEQRKKIGPISNNLKKLIENALDEKRLYLISNHELEPLDLSLPGKKIPHGHLHPFTTLENKIEEIFSALGFEIVESNEIETEYYNFDALNIPANHPARDMWDTFWIKNDFQSKNKERFLLRTHTSPIQVHYMETHQPPFRIVSPGKVYRYEALDASHDIQFHQLECLMVDENITFANFKFIVLSFFQQLFSKKINVQFTPSYFPFVEPGVQINISCPRCNQKGCSLCKNTGWLEIAGAGMVHPNVFKAVGYNPKMWRGFAFGIGLERIAMIKYNIPDIRLFNSADLRFIKQF
ncbi:MAG TPA: phenylalanine--tRNA ligase subunit alpha [Candidatus Paceibacterota bacterium]|nr:phenylalanine--tRNA ligase subunit alpha [Candidatus Paceibacterota bacterium]HQM34955.1 phenylalanine--tRNA ligase subunit alpha [Candidatus Paceibacterota bacterium]